MTLTLDRPESRNALSPELLDALGDSLARAATEAGVRVVVLTHAGPAFCAGADLSGAATRPPRHDLVAVLSAIADCPRPVVARIDGAAMGGGLGLAAACDLSVATEASRFGFTEVRLGVAPAIISVVCLPKLGRADAAELFLTGERISAARAAEVGLITTAVPTEALDATIARWAAALVAGAPGALAAAKHLLEAVPRQSRNEAFAWTGALSQELFASEEAAEGMAAFRERRHPRWATDLPGGEASP